MNHYSSTMLQQRSKRGSALLLTVVLTSLLAIVGVLFVMSSRLEKVGAIATNQSKQLDMAVDAILDQLTEELVNDVPGVAGQEYYDAADANDPWLSSAEPYYDGNDYYWRQATSLEGHSRELKIEFVGDRKRISDVDPNTGDILTEQKADADGDGLADTYWFKLEGFKSSRGRPIYAAVRVVDHGRMLNANTAYRDWIAADANSVDDVDEPSPMQVNIIGLFDVNDVNEAYVAELQEERTDALRLQAYLEDVVWHFGAFAPYHHPFDIQDEMELRSRYLIDNKNIVTRIEAKDVNDEGWGELYDGGFYTPQVTDVSNWFAHAVYDDNDAAAYDYRHISTTVSLDRVINPDGEKMFNVNTDTSTYGQDLYEAIKAGLKQVSESDRLSLAAQITANVLDFRDKGTEPNAFYPAQYEDTSWPSDLADVYYGFEVHPYISEVAFQVDQDDPNLVEVGIELYHPSLEDSETGGLSLRVYDPINKIEVNKIDLPSGSGGTRGTSPLFFTSMNSGGANPIDANDMPVVIADGVVSAYHDIYLIHHVADANADLCLDVFKRQSWYDTNEVFADPNQPTPGVWYSMARDTNGWQVAYQVYQPSTEHTLGELNTGVTVSNRSPFTVLDPLTQIGADPNRSVLENIGQIGRLLSVGPGSDPNVAFATIGERLTDPSQGAENVFVNLEQTRFSNLFQYLTVIDPGTYGLGNETRVKGRINVNTAPRIVLRGLPGLDLDPDPNVAPEKMIALYRDYDPNHVYQSVGDLMQVPDMLSLGYQDNTLKNLEERDQVFTRLADVATVRSDVFTAYILVRMGVNGPQKRVLAVMDRSQVTIDAQDQLRVLALQPVPESR